MKNTCQKGNITEAKVLARFVEKGYLVFIPFGEGHKCDLIFINDNGDLKKVQVKKCRPTGYNSFTLNLYSNGGGYNRIKYTEHCIDYFATEINNKCYLIPIQDVIGKVTLNIKENSLYLF